MTGVPRSQRRRTARKAEAAARAFAKVRAGMDAERLHQDFPQLPGIVAVRAVCENA